MRKVFLITVLALFFACFSLAQTPSGPPKPAPELANAKYFVGTWTCNGDSPASPFGPAHKTQSTLTLKSDLDGFWIAGTAVEKKTASNTQPVKGMLHIGYDSSAKQYVVLWLDNFGSWSTETSPGWQGDTITFSGDQVIMGEKTPVKDTFVKKGPNDFTHRFEMTTKGATQTLVEETCKRAGK